MNKYQFQHGGHAWLGSSGFLYHSENSEIVVCYILKHFRRLIENGSRTKVDHMGCLEVLPPCMPCFLTTPWNHTVRTYFGSSLGIFRDQLLGQGDKSENVPRTKIDRIGCREKLPPCTRWLPSIHWTPHTRRITRASVPQHPFPCFSHSSLMGRQIVPRKKP